MAFSIEDKKDREAVLITASITLRLPSPLREIGIIMLADSILSEVASDLLAERMY